MDCSAESPTGRGSCAYDREDEIRLKKDWPRETWNSNAVSMAALMGIDLLNEKEYRELQTKGVFDKNSFSWIKTPVHRRKAGVTLYGTRGVEGGVFVDPHDPSGDLDVRGFRGALRV